MSNQTNINAAQKMPALTYFWSSKNWKLCKLMFWQIMPVCTETCTKHRQSQFSKLFVAITSSVLIKIGIYRGMWKHEILKQLWLGLTSLKNVQEEVNIPIFRINLQLQISKGCKLHQNQPHVSHVGHFWHRLTCRLCTQKQPVKLQAPTFSLTEVPVLEN